MPTVNEFARLSIGGMGTGVAALFRRRLDTTDSLPPTVPNDFTISMKTLFTEGSACA
jgi:hypothetical protein